MNINPKIMRQKYIEKDWNNFFKDVMEIAKYVASNSFNIPKDEIEDYTMIACEKAWDKILKNKYDLTRTKNNNIKSFFWTNSWFAISDELKKRQRKLRNKYKEQVKFVNIEKIPLSYEMF